MTRCHVWLLSREVQDALDRTQALVKHYGSSAKPSRCGIFCLSTPPNTPARSLASHTLLNASTRTVCHTASPPSTDVDPLTTCAYLTWRPLRAQRARAPRLSAAAGPREGRATSTCPSGHCTQPASRSYPWALDGHQGRLNRVSCLVAEDA